MVIHVKGLDMGFKDQMDELVAFVAKNALIMDHSDLFHKTAEQFDLYDENGMAPIWLSRIVDGIQRDEAENQDVDEDDVNDYENR